MAITGQRRQQLNDIIGKMKTNNESDDSIREMVSQFKTKFDEPEDVEEPSAPGIKIAEGVTLSPEDAQKLKGESFIGKAEKFAKGAVTDPKSTVGGLITGGFEGVGKFGATIANRVGGAPGDPGEVTPSRDLSAEDALDIGAGRFRKPKQITKKDLTPKQKEVFEGAKPVGEFAAKTVGGIAASTLVPGAGIPSLLAQGAAANVPFAVGALEEGGVSDAIKDMAINTAIDLATLGASKAIPGIKQAILKKFGKDVSEEAAERLAKEAFGKAAENMPTIKDVPLFQDPERLAAEALDIENQAKQVERLRPKSTSEIKGAVEEGFEVGGQKLTPSQAPKKKLGEKVFGRIKEGDRSILSEPLKEADTPFTEYAKLASSANDNPRNMTAMDFAGSKGSDAVGELDELRKVWGQKKGDLIEGAAGEIPVGDLSSSFNNDVKKFMGVGLTDGKIKGISKAPSQNKIVEDAFEILNGIGESATVKDLDNAKSALFDLIQSKKAGQIKPNVGKAEAVVKKVRSKIDELLDSKLGPDFKEANKNFGQLKDDIEFLNRKFGQVVDKETGVTERGASLLKTALQSNSDKGTKAVLKRVQELTGIDLIKEAKFAQIAMEAVGDTRAKGLVGEVSKLGLIKKGAGKLLDLKRGSELDELINFYNKVQGGK